MYRSISFSGPLSRRELALLCAVIGLVLLALMPIDPYQIWPGQLPAPLHEFADTRSWWGLPNALDVLSNLPFALFGIWGLASLGISREPHRVGVDRPCATLFYVGLLCTCVGSSYYHLQPLSVFGLAMDRAGMSVAFAGMLGLAIADRFGVRAAHVLAVSASVAALGAVLWWWTTGSVWPWAVVQFGGFALILAMALVPALVGVPSVSLPWVIGCYGLAKCFEMLDGPILLLTHQLISGHSLKHLAASGAALAVLYPVAKHRDRRSARQQII